jgi:hypothetical protein
MAETNRYQVINTFSGGMNTDADKSVIPKNQYLYAENYRIFGDSTNTVGSLENILGNTLLTSVITPGYYPIGYCNIRDELYICTTQNQHPTDGLYSELIKVIFTADGESISSHTHIYNDQYSSDGSRLNWSRDYLIKAIGRYESDTIKKIYFVDGYNIFRSMNVVSISTTSPVNKFDVIPNFNLSSPVFDRFVSGRLTSGKIQYAYQMYNLYGAETLFSPVSQLIPISETSGQTGSNKTFKGSEIDENTGKGIRFSIFPPTGFDRIRIVSIKYNSINSIPVIKIIVDQNISTNPITTYFYDFGTTALGEYTYEEFAVIGREVFVASELETKNNYLFVANITDNDWDVDFDARAYRFVSSTASGSLTTGHTAIFDAGEWGTNNWYDINSNFLIGGTTSVPETYDCLNPYNDISLDKSRTDTTPSWIHLYNFIYQVNGTTIGGEGLNVSYSFIQHQFIISNTGTNYGEDYCYNTDYSNVNVELNYKGYQRDEIYRFGIVFFDDKGRSSTVKWIGDIRMPYYTDIIGGYDNFPFTWDVDEISYGMSLGISFTVDTSSAYSQGAKYFKIVRVKRESADRTILAQGIIPTMLLYNDGSGLSYRGYTIPYTATGTVSGITKYTSPLEFISPEINFNKNLSYTIGDSLELIATSTVAKQWDNFSNVSMTIGTLPTTSNYSQTVKYSGFDTSLPISTRSSKIKNVNNFQILGPLTKINNLTYSDGIFMTGVDYRILNITECASVGSGSSSMHLSAGGTKGIVESDSFAGNIAGTSFNCYYCNYKRNVFSSQYGGNTYTARQNNSYISCSSLQICIDDTTVNVYEGDTYISMFDYLRNIVYGDIINDRRSQLIVYFPVETSINLRYRSDDCFSKTTDDPNHSRRYMQELAGIYTSSSITYNQLTDLYKYNSVYSQENTTIGYYPESNIADNSNEVHDNRILVSDLKIDRETSDSWTMFRMDNFLDVDSKYGKITSLLVKDNYLYFWQPKAFGVLSVNQRSVIQDNNPGALVLGTGGVLDRYDYLSTSYGSTCRFSPVNGINGLYWIDNINRTICRYNGEGVEPISKSKGINSLISSSITLDTETISCSDRKYNEVLFTIPYTYTTISGDSMQPSTYKLEATSIPSYYYTDWRYNTALFDTIKNFRLVVDVIEVSGSENTFTDAFVSISDNHSLTHIKKYLRNGVNIFDIGTSTLTWLNFGLTNDNEYSLGHNYKLLLNSINCYEITSELYVDEEFTYSDGSIDIVTSGVWITETYPISLSCTKEIVSNKLYLSAIDISSLYSIWTKRVGIITAGSGTDFIIEIKIDEIIGVGQLSLFKSSDTSLSGVGGLSIPLTTTGIQNYVTSDYTSLDSTSDYNLYIIISDFSSPYTIHNITIDYIKIYKRVANPIAFFTEDFDSFYTVSSLGDVPTNWIANYNINWGVVGSGYHAGGTSVSTVAPIVYNELMESFNGVYTFNTDAISLFIVPSSTNYITNSGSSLYMHNIGNRNTFYGVKYPSTLKFIANDNFEEVKTFDSFKFNSTCRTEIDDIDQYDKTFVTIRCYNDYQNSNFQTIYTSGVNTNITRKEREFVLNVPRSRVSISQPNYPNIFDPANLSNETRLFKERMRDKYLITELLYNDTGNNRFNVPYITTNYRISKR